MSTAGPQGRPYSCWAKTVYRLDAVLSKRKWQCLSLVGVGMVQVAIGGLLYSFVIDDPVEEDTDRWSESFWNAWTYMADPGSHSDIGTSRGQRIVSALITLGGIIFFAAILGMVVDVLREKMEALRQGKSKVIESDHVLILGWNDKAIHLIQELCIANESEKGGVVVVLAPYGKEEMEIELGLVVPAKQRLGTHVVFRSGSSLLASDLTKVSAHTAKAIVLFATSVDADEADAECLRCILALNSLSHQLRGHVVAEVLDAENAPLVKLVGGSRVDAVVSHDLLGRLMAMAARQPGLSKVYEAMLGFDGDEFYIAAWPELVGVPFGELLMRFPDAVPIGLRHSDGIIELKPTRDQVVKTGDEIVVIAEDNDTYRPCPPEECIEGDCPEQEIEEPKPERVLFCGWRRHLRDIILFLDGVVEPGSEVHMMTHCVPLEHRSVRLMEEGLDVTKLRNLKLVNYMGNTSVRRRVEELPLGTFTSAMIFADQDYERDTMHADSHSLATLLLCRDIQTEIGKSPPSSPASPGSGFKPADKVAHEVGPSSKEGRNSKEWSIAPSSRSCRYHPVNMSEENVIKLKESFPVVCEILDPRTQRIIAGNKQVALSSDFCQTNKLVAQIVSMIAEERSVKTLLDELWGAKGANIDVVPASRYARPGEIASFWQLSKRAIIHFDEIIIGYQERHSLETPVLNPKDKREPRGWTGYDMAVLRGTQMTSRELQDHGDVDRYFNSLNSERQIRELARELSDAAEKENQGIRPYESGNSPAEGFGTPEFPEGFHRVTPSMSVTPPKSGWDWLQNLVWDPLQASASQAKEPRLAKSKEIIKDLCALKAQMSKEEWARVELALAFLSQMLSASLQISTI